MLLIGGFLSVQAQQADSLPSPKSSKIAVYPAFGFSPETRWNYGVIAFIVLDGADTASQYYRPSSLTPFLVYTSNKQFLAKAELDLYTAQGLNINITPRFFNYPDYYFGIGNDTDPDTSEIFTDQFFRIEGRISRPLSQKLFVGIRYDLQYDQLTEIPEEGLLEQQRPLGIAGGYAMGLGPNIQYDSRNSTIYPTKGRFLRSNLAVYNRIFGSDYNYVRYVFDYRQYFEFLGPKNIVAFQFQAQLSNGEVPFYKLNKIAGDNRLRGFDHSNVYRDKQAVYFQVEGRQHLFWRFGGVVFAGVGEVFERFADANTRNLRFVYGLGGRFQALSDSPMNIRMDLGFSDNGQVGFFLSVREAF